ncbi:MAG: ribosome maturation factor RimM [Candidatus Accumulibacter sp.]|nr:ribosome maturation factor RimM [Accumulibacter sp.]
MAGEGDADGFVVLGKVVEASGLRGAVKVHPFADDPEVWGTMPRWWLGREGEAPDAWRCLRLIRCRARPGVLVAALEGIDDRDAAESLRGFLVGAPREELLAPKDGEYYWGDLLGLEVVNERGEALGQVAGLIATAANDVLRVVDEAGKEHLLPFVAAFVREVDVPGRRIRVDWETDW